MLKGIVMFLMVTLETSLFSLFEKETNHKMANTLSVIYWLLMILICIFSVKG